GPWSSPGQNARIGHDLPDFGKVNSSGDGAPAKAGRRRQPAVCVSAKLASGFYDVGWIHLDPFLNVVVLENLDVSRLTGAAVCAFASPPPTGPCPRRSCRTPPSAWAGSRAARFVSTPTTFPWSPDGMPGSSRPATGVCSLP